MGVINQQTSLGAKNIFREWDHIYVDAVEVRFFLKWLWLFMFSICFFSDVLVVMFSSKSREKNIKKLCGYLVGGLEHDFYDFPYIGNSSPN